MTVRDELLALSDADDTIYTRRVVEWARTHPDSELHKHFQWDVNKAAYAHWLWQARRLISVYVVTDAGERETIALTLDYPDGGGYRPASQVLNNADLRYAALQDALAELQRWQDRHKRLQPELTSIFRAITRSTNRLGPSPSAEAA
ncbi:MAG TPA: hypothetical protein VJ890_05915 [Vineibacter sp.]|nr:hypothetical protein [Vineibacter sp.]